MSRHRNKAEKARDRAFLADLYAKHYSERMMLATINEAYYKDAPRSRKTVRDTIAEIEADWRERMEAGADKRRRQDLAGLDKIEAEAWAEWERSKQDKKQQELHEERGGPQGTKNRKVAKIEGRLGDAGYLLVILKTKERRAKMLGDDIQSPLDVNLTNKVGMSQMLALAQSSEYANVQSDLPEAANRPPDEAEPQDLSES